MTKRPLVSVIMITYNHENYIEQAIKGVLIQKCNFNIELIIANDNSPDNSDKIIRGIIKNIPENIMINYTNHNTNKGMIPNFVWALNQANGKYIALCEGDDYWTDPLKLQKQVDILESNKEYVCCHHWQKLAFLNENDKFIEKKAPIHNQGYLPGKIGTVQDIFENKLRIKTRTTLYRNIITDDFFPDWYYKVAFGDVPLSFLMGKYGDFYFIDEPMAVYRQTNEGVSTAGIKELGNRNFTIQHFKNWIEIWDFANAHYDFKYNKASQKTVSIFYKKILANINSFNLFTQTLKYNLERRNVLSATKFYHTFFLFKMFLKKGLIKIKNSIN